MPVGVDSLGSRSPAPRGKRRRVLDLCAGSASKASSPRLPAQRRWSLPASTRALRFCAFNAALKASPPDPPGRERRPTDTTRV